MSDFDNTIWSWSRLNNYHQASVREGCFHLFKRQYIEGDRGEGNYFSEYGTLVHETTEKLHKGELLAWDLENELKNGLSKFEHDAPFFKMKKSYEDALFKYFDEFESVFKDIQIQQAEEEKVFEVDGIKLKGFPDLIGQHKNFGMFIGDYKTARVYDGDKLKHNIKQLYLYSIPFFNEYGYWPQYLIYIYPREKHDRERAYRFDMKELEATKKWVIDTVANIKSHGDVWEPRCNNVDGSKDFFACQLCNHRNTCEYRYSYTNSVTTV